MVEKENKFTSEIETVIEDHSEIKNINFIGTDNLFEKINQTLELDEINCGFDKLVANFSIVETNVIVCVDESEQDHDQVETFDGCKYDFVILDFLDVMDELSNRIAIKGWVNMFEFFDKRVHAKKLFEKYKFCPLSHVMMKSKINCKLVFHIIYTAIEVSSTLYLQSTI